MRWQLASTFAVTAMSAGCYGANTVVCGNGVLCPEGKACTGNDPGSTKPLCGEEADVEACAQVPPMTLCVMGNGDDGLCVDNVCSPCTPDLHDCRYADWRPMTSPVTTPLLAVNFAAPDRAYAVGGNGTALTYEADRWVPGISMIDAGNSTLHGVWTLGDDVMVVGAVSVRTNQGALPVPGASANGLWGDNSKLIAVGGSEVTGSYDGMAWAWDVPSIPVVTYTAVWGWPGGGAIAVGVLGEVRRLVGASWVNVQPAPPMSGVFNGVWGVSENDFFVVGHRETGDIPPPGLILHFTNGSWTDMTPPGAFQLNAVWGAGATEVYAVGVRGRIVRFDGASWSRMEHMNETTIDLNHISGFGRDAMVVSNSGTIWRISPAD